MKQDPWEFINTISTMHISSISTNGSAHSSYAPFIQNEQKFYICISGMAKHTHNLLHNKTISIMIIEDESKSTNLFARKRITLDVEVATIERDSVIFNGAMTLFQDSFGELANIYKNMLDFQLFELHPVSGRAVFGFGEAYNFHAGNFSSGPVGGGGHKSI